MHPNIQNKFNVATEREFSRLHCNYLKSQEFLTIRRGHSFAGFITYLIRLIRFFFFFIDYKSL